jgi:hypothetical protein
MESNISVIDLSLRDMVTVLVGNQMVVIVTVIVVTVIVVTVGSVIVVIIVIIVIPLHDATAHGNHTC